MASYKPVYSVQFVVYNDDAPNTDFLVPSGFTAVIREMSCYQTIGEFAFQVSIANVYGGPGVVIFRQTQAGVDNYVEKQGHWVVPGEGQIHTAVSTIAAGCSMYVGGYLLRNDLD